MVSVTLHLLAEHDAPFSLGGRTGLVKYRISLLLKTMSSHKSNNERSKKIRVRIVFLVDNRFYKNIFKGLVNEESLAANRSVS